MNPESLAVLIGTDGRPTLPYSGSKSFSSTFQSIFLANKPIHDIDLSRRMVIAVNSAWPEADSNERQLAFSKFLSSINNEVDKEVKGTQAN
jgi:hypothetical protein